MTPEPVKDDPLPPGSVIGILGGGQLGRMLSTAAVDLGFRTHIFAPDADSPAFDAARFRTVADYEDEEALARFADSVDVVTYEFENVPAETAALLEARLPVRPGRKALAIAQDRLEEKRFAASLSVETASFWPINTPADFGALPFDGQRFVLKTRRLGYDGKGQAIVRSRDEAEQAFLSLNEAPAVIEAFVPFDREISVVLARSPSGEIRAFEPGENTHKNHILDQTRVPALISDPSRIGTIDIAKRFAEALDYIGVLSVEFFVVAEGRAERLLVNEIAPRVHNSGHWTTDGAATSQFEQHIRAIAGWPLGAATTLCPTTMTNLIGEDAAEWSALASRPDTRLHLYGKADMRPGRKMGHINQRKS